MKTKNLSLFALFFGTLIFSMVAQTAFAQVQFSDSNSTSVNQSVTSQGTDQQNGITTIRGQDFIQTSQMVDATHGKGTWQNAPEWILDFTDQKNHPVYSPYLLVDNLATQNYLTYQSAQTSITFYQNSCSIKVFNGGRVYANEIPLVNDVSFSLQNATFGSDIWTDNQVNSAQCNISYTQQSNGITLDMTQADSKTIKDIRFVLVDNEKPEAKLRVTNLDQSNTNTKFGFAVSMTDTPKVNIDNQTLVANNSTIVLTKQEMQNQIITLDNGTRKLHFDTQDNINHYLWAVKINNDNNQQNVILDYKDSGSALSPSQTLEIDPTWTSAIGTVIAVITDNTRTDCLSLGSPLNNGATSDIDTPPTGSTTFGCREFVTKFSTTSFPRQTTVTGVTYQYDVIAASNAKNCDFTAYTTDASSDSAATKILNLASNTRYVTNTSQCTTVGTVKTVSLGAQAITDFTSGLASNRFSVGNTFNVFNKSTGSDNDQSLTNMYVIVTYNWSTPFPISDLACNDNAINSVACNWSVPQSSTTILGYYETLNNTLHAPLYTSHLKRYYKLDYDDPTSHYIDYASGVNGTLSSGSFVNKTGIIASAMNFTGSQYITSGTTNLPLGSTDRTISLWVKRQGAGDGSGYIGYGTGGATNSFNIWILGDNTVSCGDLLTNPATVHSIGLNDWNFVTCSLKSGTMNIYLNGTLERTSAYTENTQSGNLLIGARYDGASTKASIDDVRIYDYALPQSQITQVYNYRIINTNSFTNTVVKYPFTYNINVQGVSYNGMINQYLGNTVQIAPYNVIDPPYQVKATLGSDSNGFFENVTFAKPKVANSICGSYCTPNGYQIQHYNTTTHAYQTDSSNQTSLFYVLRLLNQNTTQNIRLFTNNHAGLSTRTFPLNQTTYPQEVSHWFLQNNLVDTRNIANGTLTGNWNFTTGKNGNAQYFDGSSYDSIANNSVYNFTKSSPFSISFWEKTSSSGITQVFVDKFGTGTQGYFIFANTGNQLAFQLINSATSNAIKTTSSPTFIDNNWHNVVLTYDGSSLASGMKHYVDGVSYATTIVQDNLSGDTRTSSPLTLGARNTPNFYITGLMSDVRIFNTALTQQQITNLYNEAIQSKQTVTGSITATHHIVANIDKVTPTITMSGFPQTFTLTKNQLVNGSTTTQTNNTSVSITPTYNTYPFWQKIGLTNNADKVNATVNTGSSNLILTSSVTNVQALSIPTCTNVTGADTPCWYGVATRLPNTNINLKLIGYPITFNTTCTLQSTINPNDSISFQYRKVGYLNENYTQFAARNTVYGRCTDAPVTVFSFSVAGNQTGNAGVLVFGDVLGSTGFFGLPWTYLIILLIASTITAKDSVIGIIATVAMIGILATTGSIANFTDLVWSAMIMLAAFGVFMGKKLFS